MNNENRSGYQCVAKKLQTRIDNLTRQLLSATDYETALHIAVDLMDAVHDFLNQLPEPEDSRVH